MKTFHRRRLFSQPLWGTLLLAQFAICILQFAMPLSLFAATPFTPTQPDPILESYRWRSFPELSVLGLQCMAEDSGGRMWFGVNDGVRIYDGVTWTAFTEADGIPGPPVVELMCARDGTMYAATRKAICRFRQGTWERLFPAEGNISWIVSDLEQDRDGNIWAATGWGALRLTGGEPELYTSGEAAATVRTLTPGVRISTVPEKVSPFRNWGQAGFIFAGWGGYGNVEAVVGGLKPGGPAELAGLRLGDRMQFSQSDSGSVTYSVSRGEGAPVQIRVGVAPAGLEGGVRSFDVFSVYVAPDGAMWFGLRQGEIVRYDPGVEGDGAWTLYAEADGLDVGYQPRVLQARDGTVWAISEHSGHGVNRFDGKTWTNFKLGEGEISVANLNTSILETRDGVLWIGGNGGVAAYVNGEWRLYGRGQELRDVPMPRHRVRLLEASDGALWVAGLGQEAARLDYATSRWTAYQGIIFACETPDGAQWFVGADSSVVRREGNAWTRYGVEDGLMEDPWALVVSRDGVLWASGSQDSTAATARFDGTRWALETHPQLAAFLLGRGTYAAPDGSVWFGAGEFAEGREYTGGILRYDAGKWTWYKPPQVPERYYYGFAQTADGTLWAGGTWGLVRYDGKTWTQVHEPAEVNRWVDRVYSGPGGDLWVGTRLNGVFRFDGTTWTHYDMRDGVAGNGIWAILQTSDRSVWVATANGISRFDGRTWTPEAVPLGDRRPSRMVQASDGALWFGGGFRSLLSIRYEPDAAPPQTEITLSPKEVSQPGNTTLAWKGADPWRSTPDGELQYSYRMNGGEWSAFTPERSQVFETLPPGNYTFEVRARDRDLNVDPTPASVVFTVVPPVWREPWFIGLMAVLLGAIALQARRIVSSNRKLREANTAMSAANKDLFQANRELDRERAMERVRAEVTSMQNAGDLQDIVREMLKEISSSGIDYELCVINIVNEESDVVRKLTSTKSGWSEEAETRLSGMSAQFRAIYEGVQPVVRETNEALTAFHREVMARAGVAGADAPTAIVDVPFAYGTLSLSTARPDGFTEEQIAILADFAEVITLGYARYLDFQKLEVESRERAKEAALERIRAEVASMKESDDIGRVMGMVFKEVRHLGVKTGSSVIMVADEEAQFWRQYALGPKEMYGDGGYQGTPVVADVVEGIDLYRGDRAFRDDDRMVAAWRSQHTRYSAGGRPKTVDEIQADTERLKNQFALAAPEKWLATSPTVLTVPFSHGLLLFNSGEHPADLREKDLEVVKDFAQMISLGYARFEDFQRLEEQNRALEAANTQIQEANRLKSQFLANMSHELRTPMNAIIGFTRMVLRRAADVLPDRQKENLEKVKASADHLMNLINEILDLSKIEAGRVDVQVAPFDVARMIETCCATVGPTLGKPGVKLRMELAEDLGEANTDEARLRQVVINLVSNALKFTDEGEVLVKAGREEADLVISVSDTGIGIPEDKLDRVFEEFEQVDGSNTRRHGGTGLGLAISKKLVGLMGGTIGLESREGEGSTFTVRVPAVYGGQAGDPGPATSALHGSMDGERTIVAIDDDPNVAVLLRQELEGEGYRIVSAQSADEGIRRVKAVRPVAVTVDIMMPGKDGWDTIRMLKADPETRDVPIIVLSVLQNRELGFRLGVNDYLLKPVERETLLASLGRLDSGEVRDVLVVDDDPTTLSLFREMLSGSGLEPRTAQNGAEALAEIHRKKPDAILLDLMMPVMDGFEVIEKLQGDPVLKQVPVVVITAKDLSREEEDFLKERVSRVVEKGHLDPDSLAQDLKGMLKQFDRQE